MQRPDVAGSLDVTYNVYRNSTSPVPIDAGHRVTSGITETNYTDCGNVYNRYYAVTAVNENGESEPSNEDRASESCGSAMAMTLPVLNVTALTESGEDPVITKYYFAGGKRVAMDRDGVVQYLVGDHLGSTSLVMDDQGSKVAESRHYPYGEERWSSGTLPTDYRFTGQRSDSYIKLVHMGARFYDSQIARWLSADAIVPDFIKPQSLNRYSYVFNRPLNLTDPSGHCPPEDRSCKPHMEDYTFTYLYWLQMTHPAPEGFHWTKAEVEINSYNTPLESDFSGTKISEVLGLEGEGSYKEDFLYDFHGVAGQGSGVAENGKLIGAVLNPGGWEGGTLVDRDAFRFGIKTSLPKPLRVIAINPEKSMIPKGATVYIPSLDAQLVDHDGVVRALDSSSALLRSEIDLYMGVGRECMSGPPRVDNDPYVIYFWEPD